MTTDVLSFFKIEVDKKNSKLNFGNNYIQNTSFNNLVLNLQKITTKTVNENLLSSFICDVCIINQ